MKAIKVGIKALALGLGLFLTTRVVSASDSRPTSMLKNTDQVSKAAMIAAYGNLPMSFEANQGQTVERARFLSHGRGYALFLTGDEAVLRLNAGEQPKMSTNTTGLNDVTRSDAHWNVLRVRLEGANRNPGVTGMEQLPGNVNYFVGKDSRQWRTNIPTYARVKYANVYPGIDLIYHGSSQHELEYDFVVGAGRDAGAIDLAFAGADSIELNQEGDLVIKLRAGEIVEHVPVVYQEIDGRRRAISCGYLVRDNNHVGFRLAAYDKSKPVVIDPKLAYSTYLGGANYIYGSIAVDSHDSACVIGATGGVDFPTTPGSFQPSFGGASGGFETFVTKFNPEGSQLVYSTYLGGSNEEFPGGIAVDSQGNAYVTGYTTSANFPTTPGAFQTSFAGGGVHGFVSKLNNEGSQLIYSTFLSGSGEDFPAGIALDWHGNAYVTGFTTSTNFPTTPGAFQTSFAGGRFDAFVTKLNSDGSQLIYSTYLGGSGSSTNLDIGTDIGTGIAVDSRGEAYVTGETISPDFPTTPGAFQTTFIGGSNPAFFVTPNAFVTKLNSDGSQLIYSTYLGGNGSNVGDQGSGIMVDQQGNAYVTGLTASPNFPITPGAFQAILKGVDVFVTKFNPSGNQLAYSTFVGVSNDFNIRGAIAVDQQGDAYVTGGTRSTEFPTTLDAYQASFGGGSDDAFLTKLNSEGTRLLFSTYLGGNSDDAATGIAVDLRGNAYIKGSTGSNNFPTTPGAYQPTYIECGDAFVTEFQFEPSFAGQPGEPNCHGKSVSALGHEFGSLKAAASALGFSSVKALQTAIMQFCKG